MGLFCFWLQVEAQELRTFTSRDGQSVRAAVVDFVGETVTLQREDGRTFPVPLNSLSEEDVRYVKSLDIAAVRLALVTQRARPTVEAKTKLGRKEKRKRGYVEYEERDAWYDVTVKLPTSAPVGLTKLRAEYRQYKFSAEMAAEKRSDGELEVTEGTYEISLLNPGAEVTFSTEKVALQETKLASGVVWIEGGRRTSADELRGVWVRLYSGDTLLVEYATPSNLPERQTW